MGLKYTKLATDPNDICPTTFVWNYGSYAGWVRVKYVLWRWNPMLTPHIIVVSISTILFLFQMAILAALIAPDS